MCSILHNNTHVGWHLMCQLVGIHLLTCCLTPCIHGISEPVKGHHTLSLQTPSIAVSADLHMRLLCRVWHTDDGDTYNEDVWW